MKAKVTRVSLDDGIFVDDGDGISTGDPSDDIAGDIVGKIEDDAVFGMRFVFMHDSFGIMKGCKRPKRDGD